MYYKFNKGDHICVKSWVDAGKKGTIDSGPYKDEGEDSALLEQDEGERQTWRVRLDGENEYKFLIEKNLELINTGKQYSIGSRLVLKGKEEKDNIVGTVVNWEAGDNREIVGYVMKSDSGVLMLWSLDDDIEPSKE
ncbi:hypothetical protein ACFLRP_01160 [Bacteroidota bacterium]